MEVVINKSFGGFSVSNEALQQFIAMKGIKIVEEKNELNWPVDETGKIWTTYSLKEYRCDPDLVAIVREQGKEASGHCANLKIVEIPSDVHWYVEEYDGLESIHEEHRIWS